MSAVFLGVDLGGTKVAVSLWSGAGKRLGSVRWPTSEEVQPNLERVAGEAERLIHATGAPVELAAIGVSGGGPVDPERGVIHSVPNLPAWRDVAVCEMLSAALGVPAFLENDANAGALAEWRYGAGRGVSDLVFLTCSTGIGAGLVLGGRLYRGSRSLAGEIGHQTIVPGGEPCGCGRRGCLEAYAGGAGIARRLAARSWHSPDPPRTARQLTELARRGDPDARAFLGETARYLARGLAHLLFLLNPERIVLGTIAVGAGDLLLGPLRAELADLVWPSLLEGVEILPAALGSDLGDYAAWSVAQERFPG